MDQLRQYANVANPGYDPFTNNGQIVPIPNGQQTYVLNVGAPTQIDGNGNVFFNQLRNGTQPVNTGTVNNGSTAFRQRR